MLKVLSITLLVSAVVYYITYQCVGPEPCIFGYLGIFLCLLLCSMGTAKGVTSISQYVSGASITTPRVGVKSLLGTVICEAGLVCSLIHCFRMYMKIKSMENNYRNNVILLSSGISVGAGFYFTSVAVGVICGIISLMDSKDASLFFGIVALEIIPSSVGLLGFVLGSFMCEKIQT